MVDRMSIAPVDEIQDVVETLNGETLLDVDAERGVIPSGEMSEMVT